MRGRVGIKILVLFKTSAANKVVVTNGVVVGAAAVGAGTAAAMTG